MTAPVPTADRKRQLEVKAVNVLFLLVITLIIAVAVFVIFGSGSNHGNHFVIQTRMAATAIETAANNFHTEYGKLPVTTDHVRTDTPSGISLLTILLGMEESPEPVNTRGIRFLSVREGKNRRNGLIYSTSGDSIEGLFDPWGNPYTVILDTDNDEILHFKLGRKDIELKGRHAAAFSPGADMKPGTSDDVRTW